MDLEEYKSLETQSQNGDVFSSIKLALLYRKGKKFLYFTIPKDNAISINYLESAARNNSKLAKFILNNYKNHFLKIYIAFPIFFINLHNSLKSIFLAIPKFIEKLFLKLAKFTLITLKVIGIIALVLIGIAIIYFIFSSATPLSIPSAIIIGALIIAFAINNKN